MIDVSSDRNKSTTTISKAFGISAPFSSNDDVLASSNTTKEFSFLRQIVERLQRGNLPFLNDDNYVEFPSQQSSSVVGGQAQPALASNKSGTGLYTSQKAP